METTGDRFIRIFGQRAWQRVREDAGLTVVEKQKLEALEKVAEAAEQYTQSEDLGDFNELYAALKKLEAMER